MKQFVTNKTERIEMGKIIELRGNFIEHETEDGVSYECDYYRTSDKTATFEQVHKQYLADDAQHQLDATDYIEIQLTRTERLYGKESEEYKDLLARRLDALQQRETWVEIIRGAKT